MKKKLFTLLVLVSAVVFAADYVQFKEANGDFGVYETDQTIRPQFWTPAQMITLKVSAGSTVYLSSYVNSWYGIPELGSDANPEGFNMNAGQYGYVLAEKVGDSVKPVEGSFKPGNGTTIDVTFQNPGELGPRSVTTKGYLLDTFDKDTEIFFVMTPLGYDSPINTYSYVDDPNYTPNPVISPLQSRQLNLEDFAGSTKVNIGMSNGSHQFIIGYVASDTPAPSGQPLPGVLTSCLVGLAATGLAARRRKQSRK